MVYGIDRVVLSFEKRSYCVAEPGPTPGYSVAFANIIKFYQSKSLHSSSASTLRRPYGGKKIPSAKYAAEISFRGRLRFEAVFPQQKSKSTGCPDLFLQGYFIGIYQLMRKFYQKYKKRVDL